MAKDCIELYGVCLQDDQRPVPIPTYIKDIETSETQIATLIPANFEAYRRKIEKKVIKKSLSLPSWLNSEAEAAGINFSATLREALEAKLGIK